MTRGSNFLSRLGYELDFIRGIRSSDIGQCGVRPLRRLKSRDDRCPRYWASIPNRTPKLSPRVFGRDHRAGDESRGNLVCTLPFIRNLGTIFGLLRIFRSEFFGLLMLGRWSNGWYWVICLSDHLVGRDFLHLIGFHATPTATSTRRFRR